MEFLLNPLSFSDEAEQHHRPELIAALLAAESGQAVAGAPNLSDHHQIMSIIFKAQSLRKLDQPIVYLAINYAYRYLSIQQSNRQGSEAWAAALLAAACLSLASKTASAAVLSLDEAQVDERFEFASAAVGRMELVVLDALQWRMRSVTPFAFLRHFLFDCEVDGVVMARASKVVFEAQTVMRLVQYRPSVVAAAAIITAAGGVSKEKRATLEAAIGGCGFVDYEKLLECCNAMAKEAACSVVTPRTVLNCRFSDDEKTVGSSMDGQDLKKRRFTSIVDDDSASPCATELEKL